MPTYRVDSYLKTGEMWPGYPTEVIGKRYYPAIWHSGLLPDGNEWSECAFVPGVRDFADRRKAKRALNRYRAFRRRYHLMTGKAAPFHYE